jgi:hypothetical protein
MERTELREAFFAETKIDPYAHMIAHMVSDAWAYGYEEALRDHGLTEEGLRERHSDRVDRAVEWMTGEKRKAEAEMIIAMASLGKIVGGPTLGADHGDTSVHRYTVAVDFDGVLHSYSSPWSGADVCPDPPVPGAIDWLHAMVEKFEVVILTTRGDQEGGNEAVREWLREHGYNGPDLRVTSQKVPALVYVDDRAWRFEGDNFPTPDEVHRAIPWNKRKGV